MQSARLKGPLAHLRRMPAGPAVLGLLNSGSNARDPLAQMHKLGTGMATSGRCTSARPSMRPPSSSGWSARQAAHAPSRAGWLPACFGAAEAVRTSTEPCHGASCTTLPCDVQDVMQVVEIERRALKPDGTIQLVSLPVPGVGWCAIRVRRGRHAGGRAHAVACAPGLAAAAAAFPARLPPCCFPFCRHAGGQQVPNAGHVHVQGCARKLPRAPAAWVLDFGWRLACCCCSQEPALPPAWCVPC